MTTLEELLKSFEKDFSIPLPAELLPPGDINDSVDAAPKRAYLTG